MRAARTPGCRSRRNTGGRRDRDDDRGRPRGFGYGCADNGLIFRSTRSCGPASGPAALRHGGAETPLSARPVRGTLIAAHGMSEPDSGSDAFALRTTARADGDRWILNGSKTFVTNAPESDLFVVFATTDRELGFAGLCAFVVERETPGLTVGPPAREDGPGLLADGRALPRRMRRSGRGAARAPRARAWRCSTTQCCGSGD